mgnify:CR=1 FL=1
MQFLPKELIKMKVNVTLLFICTWLISSHICAEENVDKNGVNQTVYLSDKKDWIRLKSGEIIQGKLKGSINNDLGSYKKKIEFKSDKLGTQSIKLSDISVMETTETYTIRTSAGDIYSGRLAVQKGVVFLTQKSQQQTIPIKDVVSIYRSGTNESTPWEAKFTLGIDLKSGNTDKFSFRGEAKGERRTVDSRTKLGASYENSKANGEKTADKSVVSGSYDLYLNDRLFLRPIDSSLTTDEFQNLDYQFKESISVGYFFIANSEVEWDVYLGPGFTYTRYLTVEEGEDTSVNSAALTLGSNLSYEITKNINFKHTYKLNWANSESGGAAHTNALAFDIDLVGNLSLEIKGVWDHISHPKTDSKGVTPKKDDYTTFVSLGYTL